MGDSAGGNLATMVTAMIYNPSIYIDITSRSQVNVGTIKPQIAKLCIIYGLMARNSFFTRFYVDDVSEKCFLLDYSKDELKKFAKSTLFVCGKQDFLLENTKRAQELLLDANHESNLYLINGYHGWFSMPYNLNYLWHDEAIGAIDRIYEFLISDDDAPLGQEESRSDDDDE